MTNTNPVVASQGVIVGPNMIPDVNAIGGGLYPGISSC